MLLYPSTGMLSGSQWGTQDANGVWSGWANPPATQQAAYDPGADAAFGGAAQAYTGDPNAYAANMTPSVPVAPAPVGPAPMQEINTAGSFGAGYIPGQTAAPNDGQMMYAGGSPNFNPATGTQFASGQGGPGVGNTGGMPANPYLPQIAGDITRRTTDMMNQGIRTARGAGIMAGGFGGSAQGIMEGKAIAGAADNLAGQLGNLYGGAWNQDQSRDLQRYGMDQGFYTSQRGQDLQQAGLGASMLQQGLAAPWTPLQNASGVYSGYTGLGTTTTPGTGGGWQGALGGLLGGAQLARNFSWL